MNKYFHKYILAYSFYFLQIDRSSFSEYFPFNSILEKYNLFANKTEKSFWIVSTSFRTICQIFLHLDVLLQYFLIHFAKFSQLSVDYFPVDGVLENTFISKLSHTRQKNTPDYFQQFRTICQIFLHSDDWSRHFLSPFDKLNILNISIQNSEEI